MCGGRGAGHPAAAQAAASARPDHEPGQRKAAPVRPEGGAGAADDGRSEDPGVEVEPHSRAEGDARAIHAEAAERAIAAHIRGAALIEAGRAQPPPAIQYRTRMNTLFGC